MNGNVIYKGNYLNGKAHGLWERYWNNGHVIYKANYLNGKRHDLCENYCCLNGNLDDIEYYIT
jgi:antitoxin component YwqK of YwqJK toxin-antitoxin module